VHDIDPCLEGSGPCHEDPAVCGEAPAGCDPAVTDLAGLDESARLRVLAALTARFSAAYLRWMRSQAGKALTYSNVRVLEILESSGPTIMRDIAASLGMTPRNMTAIIDSLEEGGMVQRTAHPHDRRATVVALTPVGRREAERARQQALAWVADAFSTMTPEEQQQYASLLTRLTGFFCG
jgi:DNA-binding MarR family transcriptional regulator